MFDISIILAYYNRRHLLLNTLKSIEYHNKGFTIEVVIVNDASDIKHDIRDIPSKFPSLSFKLINISKDVKTWRNPCIANNIGIQNSSSNNILLQNPESFHTGPIVEHVINNLIEGVYLVYGCYSIDLNKTNLLTGGNNALSLITPTNDVHVSKEPSMNKWFQHSIYNPACLNFCSAIKSTDLYDLGGFDERYANGIAKDDTEFLLRLKRKGLIIKQVDDYFVLHQWHQPVIYKPELVDINTKLYNKLLLSNKYKAKSRLI